MGFNSGFKGLNKKYIYLYLKCIVYDKLLKPRQSFLITLHIYIYIYIYIILILFFLIFVSFLIQERKGPKLFHSLVMQYMKCACSITEFVEWQLQLRFLQVTVNSDNYKQYSVWNGCWFKERDTKSCRFAAIQFHHDCYHQWSVVMTDDC